MLKKIFILSFSLTLLLFSEKIFAGGGGGGSSCLGGTALSCNATTSSQSTGNCVGCDPANANYGGGACCWVAADINCDGAQDMTYSIENAKGYTLAVPAGVSCGSVITFTITTTANLQGSLYNLTKTGGIPKAGDASTDEYGSSWMGAGSFTLSTTACGSDDLQLIIDGYAGTTGSFTITTTCPTCTAPTSVSAGSDVTICTAPVSSGATSTTLAGTHSGGTGTVWRQWTPSTGLSCTNCTGPVATPTSTTTYTYKVCMDGAGTSCCKTDAVIVTVIPPVVASAGPDITSCAPSSFTVGGSPTASGGNGTFTYAWAETGANANIAISSSTTIANPTVSISAGATGTATYTVTVTSGGCSRTDAVLVTVSSAIASAGPDLTICAGTSATIGGSPTGPGGSTYAWAETGALANIAISGSTTVANPSVTSTIAASGTASYTVTVTNGGCSATDVMSVIVNPLPATPTASATPATVCAGQSSTLNVTSGTAGLTFGWWTASSGGSLLGSGTSLAVSPLVTTTYYLEATNSTTGCISARGSVTVTVTATPTASAGADASKCAGQTFTLAGTCSNCGTCTGPQTWTVVSGSGTFAPSATTLAATFTPTAGAGTYTLRLSPTGCPAGCTPVTDDVTLTVNPAPTVVASSQDDSMCVGQITTIDAVAAGGTPFPPTIVTEGPFNSTSPAQTPTNNSCASGPASMNITVSGVDSALVNGNVVPTICLNVTHTDVNDLKIELCAPGGSPCVTLVPNGTFTNNADNLTSTCFVTGSPAISTGTAPWTGSFAPTNPFSGFNGATTNGTWTLNVYDCTGGGGGTGTLNNWSISFDESTASNAYTYAWTSSTGVGSTTSASTTYSSAGVVSPSTITKTMTVTDSKGCTGTSSLSIVVDNCFCTTLSCSVTTINASSAGSCDGSIDLSVSGGNSPYSYSWSNGKATQDISSLCVGTYTVTITDDDGCSIVCDPALAGYTGIILPLELMFFKGEMQNNGSILLEWATASETNNEFFTVEKSNDAVSYRDLGIVKGAGSSASIRNYQLIDMHPDFGINYYRLKQTEFNGKENSIGNVIAINNASDKVFRLVEVKPIPVKDIIKIVFNSDTQDEVNIRFYDLAGKEVLNFKMNAEEGINEAIINISELSAGAYFTGVSKDSRTLQTKVVKY